MAKHYSAKQRDLPPSRRSYTNHMRVPAGCVDVWRINTITRRGTASIHSQWRDKARCMSVADELHERTKTRGYSAQHLEFVYVEHKAAIQIGEKWHIVNIPSFKFGEDVFPSSDPDPEHKQWLADFDGEKPEDES